MNNIHLMNINSCMNLQSKEIIDLKTKYFQFIFDFNYGKFQKEVIPISSGCLLFSYRLGSRTDSTLKGLDFGIFL